MADDARGYAYRIESRITVAAGAGEAFRFLADPASLPALDPPWVDARLVTGSGRSRVVGSEAEYLLRWFGVPLYLRMVVTELEAPRRLALAQLAGPWRRYTHAFDLRSVPGGTEIRERSDFRGGPGPFELCLHRFVIRRQLEEVVRFRRRALAEALGGGQAAADRRAS